jgi:hypothetical protein
MNITTEVKYEQPIEIEALEKAKEILEREPALRQATLDKVGWQGEALPDVFTLAKACLAYAEREVDKMLFG